MLRYTLNPKNFGVAPPPPPRTGRCRTEIWGSEKVSRYTGVGVAATVAGVALHCATWGPLGCLINSGKGGSSNF